MREVSGEARKILRNFRYFLVHLQIRLRMNQLLDCYEKLERQSRYTSQRVGLRGTRQIDHSIDLQALQKMAQDVCEMEEAIMCLTGFEFDLNLPHKHVGSVITWFLEGMKLSRAREMVVRIGVCDFVKSPCGIIGSFFSQNLCSCCCRLRLG